MPLRFNTNRCDLEHRTTETYTTFYATEETTTLRNTAYVIPFYIIPAHAISRNTKYKTSNESKITARVANIVRKGGVRLFASYGHLSFTGSVCEGRGKRLGAQVDGFMQIEIDFSGVIPMVYTPNEASVNCFPAIPSSFKTPSTTPLPSTRLSSSYP